LLKDFFNELLNFEPAHLVPKLPLGNPIDILGSRPTPLRLAVLSAARRLAQAAYAQNFFLANKKYLR
jgi:hypothetical protein